MIVCVPGAKTTFLGNGSLSAVDLFGFSQQTCRDHSNAPFLVAHIGPSTIGDLLEMLILIDKH